MKKGDRVVLGSSYGFLRPRSQRGNQPDEKIANGHAGAVKGWTPDGFVLIDFDHFGIHAVPVHWLRHEESSVPLRRERE